MSEDKKVIFSMVGVSKSFNNNNKQVLKDKIASLRSEGTFNLFSFIHSYTQQ